MDDELANLMKQFQALQHDEGPKRLNERNVIEVVLELKKAGKLDLVFTADGKEFLTWPQLKREIQDELELHGGRINIVDLPLLLNVTLVNIEKILPEVLSENPSMQVLGGEILTEVYLESVIEDTRQTLVESGSVLLADIARQAQLPAMFVSQLVLRASSEGRIDAVQEENAFYTEEFITRQKHIIRCALIGVTKPTALPDICTRHGLFASVFRKLVDTLVKAKEVPGTVEGTSYVPHLHDQSRAQAVTQFYKSNGYVQYSLLATYGINNGKVFLISRYNPAPAAGAESSSPAADKKKGGRKGKKGKGALSPEAPEKDFDIPANIEDYPNYGHALANIFLKDSNLRDLHSTVEAFGADAPCLDFMDHLPAQVDPAQDGELLTSRLQQLYPDKLTDCIFVGGLTAVSNTVLEGITAQIEVIAKEEVLQARRAPAPKAAPAAKGKKAPVEEDDHGRGGVSRRLVLVLARALGWRVEDREAELMALYEHWEPRVAAIYRKVKEEAAMTEGQRIRKQHVTNEAEIQALWQEVRQYCKGVQWVEGNAGLAEFAGTFHRHLLTGHCTAVVRRIMEDASLEHPEVQLPAPGGPIKAVLASFGKPQQDTLKPLAEALQLKTVHDFIDCVEQLSSTAQVNICLRAMNKKHEKEAFSAMKAALVAKLGACEFANGKDNAQSNADALVDMCALTVACKFRVHLSIPGKAVAPLVTELKGAAPYQPEMEACQRKIVECLTTNPDEPVAEVLTQLCKDVLADADGASTDYA